jgi:hypothetical protein
MEKNRTGPLAPIVLGGRGALNGLLSELNETSGSPAPAFLALDDFASARPGPPVAAIANASASNCAPLARLVLHGVDMPAALLSGSSGGCESAAPRPDRYRTERNGGLFSSRLRAVNQGRIVLGAVKQPEWGSFKFSELRSFKFSAN